MCVCFVCLFVLPSWRSNIYAIIYGHIIQLLECLVEVFTRFSPPPTTPPHPPFLFGKGQFCLYFQRFKDILNN